MSFSGEKEYDELKIFKKKEERARLCSRLKEKVEDFVSGKDGTIITESIFISYVEYFKVIENVFDYVFSMKCVEEPVLSEEQFLAGLLDRFSEYYRENKGTSLPPLEYSNLREFHRVLLNVIKEQLYAAMDDSDHALLYEMRQTRAGMKTLEYIGETVERIEKHVIPNLSECLQTEFICPEGYIPRRIKPVGTTIQTAAQTVEELLQTENRVVLLGEAGSGKSWELRYLAYRLAQSGEWHPVLISLDDYVDETIEDLVGISSADLNHHVLIFDGYDEIEEQNLLTFAKRLNRFVKKREQQKIVVSSRNNFYRNAIEKADVSTFRGFFECVLQRLEEDDILVYLQEKQIDASAFMEEVRAKKLNEQLMNPFFLSNMIEIYKDNQKLPMLEHLMDELIHRSFEQDVRKYMMTKAKIEEQQFEMMEKLERLSFAMQCMKKKSLEEMVYQELFPLEVRELLKYCGIWRKTEDRKWKFEHNNFREYLTACFLKKLPREEVIRLVTYEEGQNRIKTSWINVLSFLVLIYEDEDFLNWVVENEPSAVMRFEMERLNEARRTEIFCRILDEYKKKNMWIVQDWNSMEELAVFGQSVRSIDYLMQEVQEPAHFRAQSNALDMLGAMAEFYGKEEEVKKVIKDCCLHTAVRKYEVKTAIMSLQNHALYDEELIRALAEHFLAEKDPDIWYAIYSCILEYGLQEKMADYVVKGLEICRSREEKIPSEIYRLGAVLKEMRTYEALHSVMMSLIEDSDLHYTVSLLHDNIRVVCNHAQELYDTGDTRIVCDIQQLFLKASVEFESWLTNLTRQCLVQMKCIFLTYQLVWECIPDEHRLYVLEDLMDEECIDDFAGRYRERCQEAIGTFIQYVERRYKGQYRYDEFRKLIYEMDGCEIKEREVIDYKKREEEKAQKAFSELFDLVKSQKIGEGEFLHRSVQLLKKKECIKISEEQEKMLVETCRQVVRKIDFTSEAVRRKDGAERYSGRLYACLWLTGHYSITYEEAFMKKLIFFSPYMFGEETHEMWCLSKYVLEHIPDNIIRSQILENLQENEEELVNVYGEKAAMCMKYCNDHDLTNAVSLAECILPDVEYDSFVRRMAANYLLKIKGAQHMIDRYLKEADAELLEWMAVKLGETKDERLITRLVRENAESEEKLLYLKELIQLQPETGLAIYYQLAREKNTVPDSQNDSDIAYITEEIAEVSDEKCLNQILELTELTFCEKFRDRKYWGLGSSVYKALIKIGQNAPLPVMEAIRTRLENLNREEELAAFLTVTLEDVQKQYDRERDEAWSVKQVKGYFEGNSSLL